MKFSFGYWRQRPYSLATRFIALVVSLFVVLQTVQLLSFTESVRTTALVQQNQGFDVARNVLMSQLAQRQQMLTQSAQVLASDFGLRSAVAGHDVATIESALENHAQRIGAPIAVLLSPKGAVVASTLGQSALLDNMIDTFNAAALKNKTNLFSHDNQLYQFVKMPVKGPNILGYIVMGFAVESNVLDQFTNVSSMPALVVHEHEGIYYVQDSNLPAIKSGSTLEMDPTPGQNMVLSQAPGQTFRPVLLTTASSSEGHDVYILLSSSLEKALARYKVIEQQVMLLTAIGGILFSIFSVQIARKLTRPLRKLMLSATHITEGDLDTPIRTRSNVAEIQTLSSSLDTMRESVRSSQEKIHEVAYTDPLTGLPNRLQLLRDAARALDTSRWSYSSGCVFLLMFDLQRFKNVNDVLGYESADNMLINVGKRAKDFCTEYDLRVARVSADEFAVLFPSHTREEFEMLTEQLQDVLEKPMHILGVSVDVNTVGGFSAHPYDAQTAEDLLKHAEIAMYEAKRRRRHTMPYHSDMDASSQKTLSLLSELREAIVSDQLRLFVQPKIDLATYRIDSLELLVRWQHPTKGLVPPLDFIPFAEQTGFIRQLTQWVFETATKQQAVLKSRGLDLCLSLNLSVHDLMDPHLLSRFTRALEAQNVAASTFCLEITESAIMDDPSKAQILMEELRSAGFKLSIDDFGTGYSSLAYLKLLPVHELKIDKSFVMHMDTDPLDAKIVRSTIDLAHNLDLYVTAEGIENASILEALALLGCDKAQGYHICRPMAFENFLQWIETSPYRPDLYLPVLSSPVVG